MDLTDTSYLGSSDFLKSGDITAAGGQMQMIIGSVGSKDFTEEGGQIKSKLTLQFTGVDKGVVLNITNTRALVAMFGPETNLWSGQSILLTVRQTEMGPGIMVTPLKPQAGLQAQQHSQLMQQAQQQTQMPQQMTPQTPPVRPVHPTGPGVPFNDDIPY